VSRPRLAGRNCSSDCGAERKTWRHIAAPRREISCKILPCYIASARNFFFFFKSYIFFFKKFQGQRESAKCEVTGREQIGIAKKKLLKTFLPHQPRPTPLFYVDIYDFFFSARKTCKKIGRSTNVQRKRWRIPFIQSPLTSSDTAQTDNHSSSTSLFHINYIRCI
jgi:hypothetical protein